MLLSDLLELTAIVCLTVAVFLIFGVVGALVTAAAGLGYLSRVHVGVALPGRAGPELTDNSSIEDES